ncbi:hypothetical protein D9756_008938 [Leucocoprinus leucothites]|uniref:F-box domain-containing protein n=1 Tax=Leucocoprinus leucothites TaxID=201217 RepID=A0A8H5FUD0_9AGAR|nr:hypothetical protein D9756_008938 [Leucoagaricus leucothites]
MDCVGGYEMGLESTLDLRLAKKMRICAGGRLEGYEKRYVERRSIVDARSPFEAIPLEVLGHIFLEYYYDEEVQQNKGYFIGANWERWSRPGTAPSVANMVGSCEEGDAKTDAEQRLGHPGAVLGLVCRSWRKVYINTPRLWSSIRIWLNLPYTFYSAQNLSVSRWNRRERDMSAITRQIELHLHRSRAVPLSIEIQTNCFNPGAVNDLSAAGELFGQVLDAFVGDIWRIHDLVVKRTDYARTAKSPHKLPFSAPTPAGGTGLATPPYSASPRSPCHGFRNPLTLDNGAISALEMFITKLDRLRSLTLDNWGQDAFLNLAKPDNGKVLPGLRSITLQSSSPTFCCSGIPWYQITKFTSYHSKLSYGQLFDLLGAMPLLTTCDVKMSYNEPGVTTSPYPSPQQSPLPSPNPTHSRYSGGFFGSSPDREGSGSPRRRSHVHLPFLTHLSLQGLPKSIQLLLCSLKAKQLKTLKLHSFEAGIGIPQVLSDQCACESLFRFLRRSQCSLDCLRVDAMFLVPPQPSQPSNHDPKYIYSYILKPDFAPLQNLKTLIIGRGHPDVVEKLLLTLAWKGDPNASDLFPELEEFGCEMKLGHAEINALAGLVMSRIPSGVVFVRQPSARRGLPDAVNARLWPILPEDSNSTPLYRTLHQQLKKYPTRLRLVHAPSTKCNINVAMCQYFRSWFPDFPHDSEIFLPQLVY